MLLDNGSMHQLEKFIVVTPESISGGELAKITLVVGQFLVVVCKRENSLEFELFFGLALSTNQLSR